MSSRTLPRRLVLAAMLAALLPASTTLAAAPPPARLKGGFDVGMIEDGKGGFAYCLMRGKYGNGLQLAIALSPKHEVNIGVVVPEGGFTKDDKFLLKVRVDDIFERGNVAMAPQPELLMAPMGADKKAITALKKGRVLALEGPEDIAYFSLKGSAKGLRELERCVGVGTGKIKMPEPKTAANGKAGKPPAFPAKLARLLKEAGLDGLEIMDVPDPSRSPVDYAWRADGVMGGLRERAVPEDMTLEKMTTIIAEGYRKQCEGMFNVVKGDAESLPGVNMRALDVACQTQDKYAYVALLVYLTDTRLFSMFMHEADGPEKPKAMKARDKVAAAIRGLAKKQDAGKPAPKPEAAAPAPPPAPSNTGEKKDAVPEKAVPEKNDSPSGKTPSSSSQSAAPLATVPVPGAPKPPVAE